MKTNIVIGIVITIVLVIGGVVAFQQLDLIQVEKPLFNKSRIVDVAVGGSHGFYPRVFAIAEDGTLWRWGVDLEWSFGIPPSHSISPVQFGTDTNWEEVSVARNHMAAIKTDGTLWTWRDDSIHGDRLIGRETGVSAYIPVQVGIATNWKEVSGCSALALRTDGTLWELGENQINQPGTDTNWKQAISTNTNVGRGWDIDRSHEKVGIRTDGTLWRTHLISVDDGRDWWGMPRTRREWRTTQIGTDTDWERLSACGAWAIRRNGTLWVLVGGWNDYGQIGLGHTDYVYTDLPIQIGTDTWKYVSASDSHTLGVRTDGTLWAWGRNHWGQLGLGHGDDRTSPIQVGTDTNWKRVFAGDAFSLALKTDGTLWAWGHNHLGQLGLGDVTARLYPTRVYIRR